MTREQPIALGIDVGTGGVRVSAVVGDAVVAESQITFPLPARTVTVHEQEPQSWWAAVLGCLRDICKRIDGERVNALSVDGTSGTILLVDHNGNPLTTGLMYDDCRADEEAAAITREVPSGGMVHTAASPLAKALWLIHQEPPEQPFFLSHQADWISSRLSGRFGVTDENNALKTGYDPVARRWPNWLQGLGLPLASYPTVLPIGTPYGRIVAEIASSMGIWSGCQVISGTTDSVAAFLATGADQIGDAATALGTTLAIKMLVEQPAFDHTTGIYSHRLGDRWLIGGASNVGGAVLLEHFTLAEIERLSSEIDPDAPTGLSYYPLSRRGERFPINNPAMLPRLEPRPSDRRIFLQAMFEGLAQVERLAYEKLMEISGIRIRRVFSSGGASLNPALTRLRSHALQCPILVGRHLSASAGVARLAQQALRP
jgi:D-ribulokinase